jgi:hypothetical protein
MKIKYQFTSNLSDIQVYRRTRLREGKMHTTNFSRTILRHLFKPRDLHYHYSQSNTEHSKLFNTPTISFWDLACLGGAISRFRQQDSKFTLECVARRMAGVYVDILPVDLPRVARRSPSRLSPVAAAATSYRSCYFRSIDQLIEYSPPSRPDTHTFEPKKDWRHAGPSLIYGVIYLYSNSVIPDPYRFTHK